MAARPMWQGHLRLSLVTCPVALFSAVDSDARVRFHMVNPKTMNRINVVPKDPDAGLVERARLVKGFDAGRGKVLQLTEADFDAIKLDSTRIIDIESFVPADSIDRIYWDSPHYLVPDGRTGVEAFAVIREAMEQQQQVALGKLVIQTRERLCAMEPREGCILLTTLRTHDEVRDPDSISGARLPRPTAGDLRSAKALVDKLHGRFDPKSFVDRYDKALRALVARKKKGHAVKKVEPAEDEESNVIDLAEALRRSLGGKAAPARTTARRKSTARRRA
jgi:DNA end-binding protein Ku